MDETTVRKVARLARLEITDEEVARLVPQLGNIMNFIEQLGEVDTKTVEPLASVADVGLPLRKDEVTDGGIADQVLANAPESMEGFFVVPKVVE